MQVLEYFATSVEGSRCFSEVGFVTCAFGAPSKVGVAHKILPLSLADSDHVQRVSALLDGQGVYLSFAHLPTEVSVEEVAAQALLAGGSKFVCFVLQGTNSQQDSLASLLRRFYPRLLASALTAGSEAAPRWRRTLLSNLPCIKAGLHVAVPSRDVRPFGVPRKWAESFAMLVAQQAQVSRPGASKFSEGRAAAQAQPRKQGPRLMPEFREVIRTEAFPQWVPGMTVVLEGQDARVLEVRRGGG